MCSASSQGSSMWPNITVTVRAHPGRVGGLDDLDSACDRQPFGGIARGRRRGAPPRRCPGWSRGPRPEALEHLGQRELARHGVHLHGRLRVQVHPPAASSLTTCRSPRSPRSASPDVSPTACRSRSPRNRRARGPCGGTPPLVLVGVRRAPALAEAAERAADGADVRNVDVAVDHEGDRVTGKLPAQQSGGWRMSSTASGRVSANSAVSSSSVRAPPSCARSIAAGTRSRLIVRSSRRPEPPRGMNDQYFVLIASSTLCSGQSGFMYCGYTHRRSAGEAPRGARRLRTSCTRGKGCSGEMWSPLAARPPRSVAPSSTSGSHQSERFGGIWMPTSGISRRHSRTSARMWSSVTSVRPTSR